MYMFTLLVWLVSGPLWAITKISSSIYDIDFAKGDQQETLILLNSGQVAKVPAGKSEVLENLVQGKKNNLIYHFILDKDRFVVEATPSSKALQAPVVFKSKNLMNYSYLPTTIPSIDVAKKYFREARYNPKDSQCFNRALVWTYEWWRKHSLKSNKILIYFTRNYIRRYNFEWWFHIAPYVHVMDEGKVVERVMDIKYTSRPLEFRAWTNIFTSRDPECMVISKFSDYADHPYVGDCYIQRTYMYTYQPADLQMEEAWGYIKDQFVMKEVRQAYLEAFDEVI